MQLKQARLQGSSPVIGGLEQQPPFGLFANLSVPAVDAGHRLDLRAGAQAFVHQCAGDVPGLVFGADSGEEQIIGFLREAESGLPVADLCRRHGFSEASYYLWRNKFGA